MPYTFHAPAPTRYPSADTLFPTSAETLTWYPAPHVEEPTPRDRHVERARVRLAAFVQARMSVKLSHAIEHVGGKSRETALAAVRMLVDEGVIRLVRRQQPDTSYVNRRGERVARTPRAGTPWLVLVRP